MQPSRMRLAPLWQQERDRIQQEAERRIQQEADRRLQQERDRIQQEADRRLQQERDRFKQQGISTTKQEIARNLLRAGMSIEQVSEFTGLSPEQVAKLRSESSDVE